MIDYQESALQIIDRLFDENKINIREMACLRRAILESAYLELLKIQSNRNSAK